MTPLTLFEYGIALGGAIVVVAFCCAVAYGIFCFMIAPKAAPQPRTLRN